MTPRLVGGIAAATFAIGILTGAAGTIVVRDASTPQTTFDAVMADHMGTRGTASMMGTGMGSMMSGSMMVPSGPGMMSPGSSLSPGASTLPDGGHDSHHPVASPQGISN